jgi:hypothetical protein
MANGSYIVTKSNRISCYEDGELDFFFQYWQERMFFVRILLK